MAGVGLQFLSQSNGVEYFAIANHTYIILRALTMEFLVLEILRLNTASQDYHSNDDVLALSDSDSDDSETVEKADFVEFLDNDSSTLAGSEAD